MKKILIWDLFQKVNTGGPSGYLYNLQQYLLEHPTEQVTFLSDLLKGRLNDYGLPQSTREHIASPTTRIGRIWHRVSSIYYNSIFPFKGLEFQIPTDLNVDEYDFVHIHQVTHFQQFKQLFPDYRGKVIITSHSPCPFSDELIERSVSAKAKLYKWFKFIKPYLHRYLIRQECDAYNKADFVMFPCEDAREPYEKNGNMRETFARNHYKFFYVPTAIIDYIPETITSTIQSDLGIPSDAFVITYFGRHIPVKGYDILKDIGISLLDKYPQLYFLCAGNGSIEPPKHPRWIELGFINNVDDILPQSDLYILPNRETYFDLITLQILRAGVPLVLSETGGNKYFKKLPTLETKGLMFFNINDKQSLEELVIQNIKNKKEEPHKYIEKRDANRKLFEKYFTVDQYFRKYIEVINKL